LPGHRSSKILQEFAQTRNGSQHRRAKFQIQTRSVEAETKMRRNSEGGRCFKYRPPQGSRVFSLPLLRCAGRSFLRPRRFGRQLIPIDQLAAARTARTLPLVVASHLYHGRRACGVRAAGAKQNPSPSQDQGGHVAKSTFNATACPHQVLIAYQTMTIHLRTEHARNLLKLQVFLFHRLALSCLYRQPIPLPNF
jgi:hypothetical protein